MKGTARIIQLPQQVPRRESGGVDGDPRRKPSLPSCLQPWDYREWLVLYNWVVLRHYSHKVCNIIGNFHSVINFYYWTPVGLWFKTITGLIVFL